METENLFFMKRFFVLILLNLLKNKMKNKDKNRKWSEKWGITIPTVNC